MKGLAAKKGLFVQHVNYVTLNRLDLDSVVKGKDTKECNVCAKLLNGNFRLFFATIHLASATLLL